MKVWFWPAAEDVDIDENLYSKRTGCMSLSTRGVWRFAKPQSILAQLPNTGNKFSAGLENFTADHE